MYCIAFLLYPIMSSSVLSLRRQRDYPRRRVQVCPTDRRAPVRTSFVIP
uniref:Uncharacterized protein n=1 Tax=Anguilla anguilla TaxID=7936 RepID=A0A0E9SLZ6_ANGAN